MENDERIKSILSDLTERVNILESSGCRKGSYIRVPVSVPSDFDVVGALREAFMNELLYGCCGFRVDGGKLVSLGPDEVSELFKEKGVGD